MLPILTRRSPLCGAGTKLLVAKKAAVMGVYRGAVDLWNGKMGRMEPPKTKEN